MGLKLKHILILNLLCCVIITGYATSEPEIKDLPRIRAAPHRDLAEIRNGRVSVSTVALLTMAMAAASGLGAVPFFFVELQNDPKLAGICNGIAGGVMLAASFDLIQEGQRTNDHRGGGTGNFVVVVGILAGAIFIWLCKKVLERQGEVSMLDIKGADAAKAILVVGIMTLHSFGEGSGVGVSFAGSRGLSQGLLITLAIAVHNIPEGLAVSMVLASRGVSPQKAMVWSIITSLPQPIVAVPSFICADAFNKFLPFCTGFAAGCMIWMVIAEVLPDAFKEASPSEVASAATVSVASMEAFSVIFENISHGSSSRADVSGLLISLLFGIGPLLGGIALVAFALFFQLQHALLTGVASGIAFVLGAWRPLQLLLSSKLGFLTLSLLLALGSTTAHISITIVMKLLLTAKRKTASARDLFAISGSTKTLSSLTLHSWLSCVAVAIHALAEGLALGVAAPKAYGLGQYMVLPVSLHGLPRGAAVASCIFGATNSWYGSLAAAALVGFVGPLSAIGAILAGIDDYSGLDHLMVFACGGLIPCFCSIVKRTMRLEVRKGSFGLMMGVGFATVCLSCTKLVCLHTPYCNSAPEAVR